MFVHHRVQRLQRRSAFQFLDRFAVTPGAEINPAQAVRDIAVPRPEIDRPGDHFLGAVIMLAPVDPGIAEIVQHVGLVRHEIQRLQQVALGELPAARALERDAASVEQPPVTAFRLRADAIDCAAIGGCRFVVPLLAAQQMAQLAERKRVLRPRRRFGFQHRDGLVEAVVRGQRPRPPHFRRRPPDRILGHRQIGRQRLAVPVAAGQDVARQHQRCVMVRTEHGGKPRIEQRHGKTAALQALRHPVENFRDAFGRAGGQRRKASRFVHMEAPADQPVLPQQVARALAVAAGHQESRFGEQSARTGACAAECPESGAGFFAPPGGLQQQGAVQCRPARRSRRFAGLRQRCLRSAAVVHRLVNPGQAEQADRRGQRLAAPLFQQPDGRGPVALARRVHCEAERHEGLVERPARIGSTGRGRRFQGPGEFEAFGGCACG